MLQITIPAGEKYDESKNEFVYTKEQKLRLEHSLVSISKWESKWKKPFLGKDPRTIEETIDYVRCMCLTQNVDPNVFNCLTRKNLDEIQDYIQDTMTATWFSNTNNSAPSREVVTSEVIYYWMVANRIPFECQKWHLNRLLTLIRVCNAKNAPSKKMSKSAIMRNNHSLNQARRAKHRTRG